MCEARTIRSFVAEIFSCKRKQRENVQEKARPDHREACGSVGRFFFFSLSITFSVTFTNQGKFQMSLSYRALLRRVPTRRALSRTMSTHSSLREIQVRAPLYMDLDAARNRSTHAHCRPANLSNTRNRQPCFRGRKGRCLSFL